MSDDLTPDQAFEHFKTLCTQFETQSACARYLGVSDVYVSDVLRKQRPMGKRILEALKLKKIVTISYRRVE